jgi:hypothetical protein
VACGVAFGSNSDLKRHFEADVHKDRKRKAPEEVGDPPPPGDTTEGTQLEMALVATQPEVAVLRGVVPTA